MNLKLKPNLNDIFIGSFIIVLISSLLIAILSLNTTSGTDNYVYVKHKNVLIKQMNLQKDEIFIMYQSEYQDLLGDLEVTVKNGKVGITKQTSPKNICAIEYMGWSNNKGKSLVCAPNNVVVEIGDKNNADVDWGS